MPLLSRHHRFIRWVSAAVTAAGEIALAALRLLHPDSKDPS